MPFTHRHQQPSKNKSGNETYWVTMDSVTVELTDMLYPHCKLVRTVWLNKCSSPFFFVFPSCCFGSCEQVKFFDTLLTLELLFGAFVTMWARLKATQVTLCRSSNIFPPLLCCSSLNTRALMHTRCQNTSNIFQFYCRMFTGGRTGCSSSLQAFQGGTLWL